MRTRLKLFFKWGIQFEDAYLISEKAERKVQYADSQKVEAAVLERFPPRGAVPVLLEYAKELVDESVMLTGKRHSPRTKKADPCNDN